MGRSNEEPRLPHRMPIGREGGSRGISLAAPTLQFCSTSVGQRLMARFTSSSVIAILEIIDNVLVLAVSSPSL